MPSSGSLLHSVTRVPVWVRSSMMRVFAVARIVRHGTEEFPAVIPETPVGPLGGAKWLRGGFEPEVTVTHGVAVVLKLQRAGLERVREFDFVLYEHVVM